MKEYYSIGEMAKLNSISTHTLRYYDKIDLLKPSYINQETGYRYYSYEDFPLLEAIQYLQRFNMSLEEIKEHFDTRTVATTLELYQMQMEKLLDEMSLLKNLEKIIGHNIDCLKKSRENAFHEEIVLVHLEKRHALIVNDTFENDDKYNVEIRKMSASNPFQHIGDNISIKEKDDIYRGDYHTKKMIGSICVGTPVSPSVKVIPAGRYLRTHYVGKIQGIGKSYAKILEHIEKNGFTIKGDVIETYAIDYIDTRKEEEYVTVIDIPV